jgi:16S rRNA (cytosine967-C5)-methyltransferase
MTKSKSSNAGIPKRISSGKSQISPARESAFAILMRVETQDSFASELLHSGMCQRLDSRDMGLCTELVMGCLRIKNQLDFIAQQFTAGRWAKFDVQVQVALRIGVYQLLYLSRIPAHAAIVESVELVRRAGKSSATGLVNAVLRRVTELPSGQEIAKLRPADISEPEWDAVEAAHPAWLLRRWQQRWGRARANAVAAANNRPPTLYVRRSAPGDVDTLIEQFRFEDINAHRSSILNSALTILNGDITRSEAYLQGDIIIQDQASQLIPALLDVHAGHRVLDVCSAPGNKASLLASAAGADGMVIAGDLHLHRLRQRFATASPEHSAPVHRLVADASRSLPFIAIFDRVLLDAPCSGTGTLGRNPEIKWRLRPERLQELSQLQRMLLRNAAASLRPGGRMVYSTCSLELEENQEVVEHFLGENPQFSLVPLHRELTRIRPQLTDPTNATVAELFAGDYLETSPEKNQTDGFFAAILERRS